MYYQRVLASGPRQGDYEDGEEDEGKVGFHGAPLIAAWLPIVNFAVIVAAMRWHKYSFYAHVFLTLIVIGLTLAGTIHVMLDDGVLNDDDQAIQKVHNVAGLIVTIWLGIQIFSGILARVIQYYSKVHPTVCLWVKRFHYISSYLIMICAKFDYLNIKFIKNKFDGIFIVLLVIDIIFLVFYLMIKLGYWQLSEEIIDNQLVNRERSAKQNQVKQFLQRAKQSAINLCTQIKQQNYMIPNRIHIPIHYKSQDEIQIQNYVIFNDFVYPTNDFKQRHPGGQYIMQLMNKRQVDRFMYGNYGPELVPNVQPFSHTQDSMRLCGQPIAKIDRISPMKGLKNFSKCSMILCQKIVENSDTFLIHLKPEATHLKFQGFQFEKQVGQYFSVTITNQKGRKRCTRLYTTIWCMRPENIEFMEKNFANSTFFKQAIQKGVFQMKQLIESRQNLSKQQILPFIIKKYKSGKLTPRLCLQDFKGQIVISEPMGAGLKYDKISPNGIVAFVCGGTGILPFCDFIDLLFKRAKFLQSNSISNLLATNTPLVKSDLVKNRQFIFYCAIQDALDLPALTVYQINELCKSQKIKFSSTMRIRKNEDLIKKSYTSIKLQKEYFNEDIKSVVKKGDISKIYLCGSPLMNAAIGKILIEEGVKQDLYHFM